MTWRVSRELAVPHDCTVKGILTRCGAGCCSSPNFWPSRVYDNAVCGRLDVLAGCTLPIAERPNSCLLYPLRLQDSARGPMLVLHHRARMTSGICRGAHGVGIPLVDALHDHLVALFGEEQYARLREAVMAGQEGSVEPSAEVLAAQRWEDEAERLSLPVVPRSEVVGPRWELNALTPWESHEGVWVKRDDLFELGGIKGGKVRTCAYLATQPVRAAGLVTAGFRDSPQGTIVAAVGQELGMPVRVHCPDAKDLRAELMAAEARGAELVRHRPGYTSVITHRAKHDALQRGWVYVPFGMECEEAVEQTSGQVQLAQLPVGLQRIVVPAGSAMSAAGVLQGLWRAGVPRMPVLIVQVGASGAERRLDQYAPMWRDMRVDMVRSSLDYHAAPARRQLGSVVLDGVYEAKCLEYLRPGDGLWVIGRRLTDPEPTAGGTA